MTWWQTSELQGYLDVALAHLNEAADASETESPTRMCELYFLALCTLWNGFARHTLDPPPADTPRFISLLRTISEDARTILRKSEALKNLEELTPEILDHSVLKSGRHRSGQVMTDSLRNEASQRHRDLRDACSASIDEEPGTRADRVLTKLAELLLVVRSNIVHGEKTPGGPDSEKAARDDEVSALVVPLQKTIIEFLFDQPGQRLVAYGTLRPGGSNEGMLKDVAGHWQPCSVRGTVDERHSLKCFRWQPRGVAVEAMLFTAAGLADAWERLDRFEGNEYARHLIPVETNGLRLIANIYEARFVEE